MTDPDPTEPAMHRPLARAPAPRRIPRWAMAGILAAPVLCLLVGLVLLAEALRFMAAAKPALGAVASISQKRESGGTPVYRANIRYRMADGTEAEGAVGGWSMFVSHDIGEEVAILYTEADPATLYPDNFVSRYGIAPFTLGFGLLLLLVVLWFRHEVGRQSRDDWFGPPPLPEPAGGPAHAPAGPGSVRRGRAGGSRLARLGRGIPAWGWWAVYGLFGIFVLIGLWLFADTLLFLNGAERGRGEVVATAEDPRSSEGTTWFATIRYRDAEGREQQGRTHISLGTYDYPPGTEVEIYHAPGRPGEVRIADFVSLWFPGLFFTLFGGLFIVLVVWLRDKARTSVAADWRGGEVLFRPQQAEAALRAAGGRSAPPEPPGPVRRRR